MAGVVSPVAIEVEWSSGTWTDITDVCQSLNLAHGAAPLSNPDRPVIAAARGHLITAGQTVTSAHIEQQFPIRITSSGAVMWQGLIAEPQETPGPINTYRWRLKGLLRDILQQTIDINEPSQSLNTLLTNQTLWEDITGSLPEITNIPTRGLRPIYYSGNTGAFLSALAAIGSVEVIETLDGSLSFVSANVASTPTSTPIVTPATKVATRPKTLHRTDRIRNEVTTVIDPIESETVQRRQIETRIARNSDGILTFSPITIDIGGSWHPDTTISLMFDNARYFAFGSFRPVHIATPDGVGAPTIDSVSISTNGIITVRSHDWPFDTDDRVSYVRIVFHAVITVPSVTPRMTRTAINSESIGQWGTRELKLPDWLTLQTDLQTTINQLSELRNEYTITIPLIQPTADIRDTVSRIDTGDYVRLALSDAGRSVDIDAVCLVTYRLLAWSPQRGMTMQLTCLETSAAEPPPSTGRRVTLSGRQVTLSGRPVTLGVAA